MLEFSEVSIQKCFELDNEKYMKVTLFETPSGEKRNAVSFNEETYIFIEETAMVSIKQAE